MALLGYVREQVSRGWSVTVACPSQGWLGYEARVVGARVRWFSATRDPGPSTLAETARLRRIVREERPDAVHLHSSKAGMVGRLAVRSRIPTMFQPHGWSFLAGGRATSTAALWWERYGARWTDQLICVGDGEAQAGREAGIRGPVTVVPNGVDLDRFVEVDDDQRREVRSGLGLADVPTAVCVGRLSPQKGQHHLLDAWARVLRAVPDAQLVLVGDGPDERDLRRRAESLSGVRFVGVRSDVPAWLAAADVVVLPSAYEGAALAPMEAMACGRSVIATRVGGIEENLPFECGELVPPGDVGALATAVARRLLDPRLAAVEGARGRLHVATHKDSREAARRVSQVTLSLLAARQRG